MSDGSFDGLSSKEVYMGIHATHVNENPASVYTQEDAPRMNTASLPHTEASQTDSLEAGIYRTGESQVGFFFENLPQKDLETVGDAFFQEVDVLLSHAEFLSKLSREQKLLILVILDQMMVVCHFVKNASGRTGEDFLHYIARKMELDYTLSTSGFRGQMPIDDLEIQMECTFWIFRHELQSIQNVIQEGRYLLQLLHGLGEAARVNDAAQFDELLLDHEEGDISVDPLVELFKETEGRAYHYLPDDEATQQTMAQIAAHWSLYEAEPYYPDESNAQETKRYIDWHFDEMTRLASKLDSSQVQWFIDLTRQKVDQAKLFILQTEQQAQQEEEDTKNMLASMAKPYRNS